MCLLAFKYRRKVDKILIQAFLFAENVVQKKNGVYALISIKCRSKTVPPAGATRLSQSLAKGAEATGSFIHKGAAKIRDRITPEETPSEVSPQVAKRLQTAKQATGGAVRVSQFLGKDKRQLG